MTSLLPPAANEVPPVGWEYGGAFQADKISLHSKTINATLVLIIPAGAKSSDLGFIAHNVKDESTEFHVAINEAKYHLTTHVPDERDFPVRVATSRKLHVPVSATDTEMHITISAFGSGLKEAQVSCVLEITGMNLAYADR
jgi:hypothetical protein